MTDLALLVVTSEAYRPLAELTGRILDRHWSGHPPTFYCGAGAGNAGTPDAWLPLQNDPVDWIGITWRAVLELRRRGYRQAYLILDDHPPLFRCHGPHLNHTLPALMRRVNAATIGLYGWGQGKSSRGTVLGRAEGRLEHLALEYPWKFALHPALWNLEDLGAILGALAGALPVERRSPWAFERNAGRKDGPLPDSLKGRAFRIAGAQMTATPLRRELVRLERVGLRSVRFTVRHLGGDAAAHRLDGIVNVILNYYEGPFPLYRSGVVIRGQLNRACMRFLTLHGRAGLARDLREAVRTVVPRLDPRSDAAPARVSLDPRARGN